MKSRLLSVGHSQEVLDKNKKFFPYSKYESYTKENFVLCCLYIMFYKSPSSINSMFSFLKDIDKDEVQAFKNNLLNYKQIIINDVELISQNNSIDKVFELYQKNKIQFYSLWWYLKYNNIDIEKIEESRIRGRLLQKIKSLLLYVTFSEKSLEYIKQTLSALDLD